LQKKKTRLGILVTAGILSILTGVYCINDQQQIFRTTFRVSAYFKDVAGLQVGNNVRYSGINVGFVENIQMVSDSTVKVDLSINESSRKFIKKNAKAFIGTDGLIGNTILIITPGAGEKIIENNDPIATTTPVSIDDILKKLKTTGDNAVNISNNLAVLMNNLKEGKGTVGKLFMDPVFAKNVGKTVVTINTGAGGFKKNMEAAKHSFLLRNFFEDKKTRKEKRVQRRKERREARKKN
jgi:phospholipid/cholesterol/gamma-HCH transport system substrate-binding protein